MQQVIIKRITLIKSVILCNALGWSNSQAALGARFRTDVVLRFPCDWDPVDSFGNYCM